MQERRIETIGRDRRRDWRFGNPSRRRWDLQVASISLLCAAAGVIASLSVGAIWDASRGSILSSLVLWLGMALGIGFAFVRSRPPGLLRFRIGDLLVGISVGVALRVLQGVLADVNSSPFPSLSEYGDARLSALLTIVITAAAVGPVLEEMLFRGVVLVALHQSLRRSLGSSAATVTAVLVSSGCFVLLHAVFEPVYLGEAVQLFLLGTTCALAVLLTGRLWIAVLIHSTYNFCYLAVATVGSIFVASA